MRKTILFTAILLIAVTAAAVLYFSSLQTDARHSEKALLHIPSDAAIVVGFKYDDSFRDIFKNYGLFNALTGEQKAGEIKQLGSLLAAAGGRQTGENIFLSVHYTNNAIEMLWLLTFNKDFKEENLESSLLNASDIKAVKTGNYYQIGFKNISRPFFLYLNDDFALGSFTESLVKKAIDTQSPKIDNQFVAEINANNQKNANSPFNLFINHHTLYDFSGRLLDGKPGTNLNLLKDLAGFSTLNMNFKSDALMFNGISRTGNNKSYLNLFLKQHPVNNNIIKAFPANTSNFLAFALSNDSIFFQDLHHLLQQSGELERFKNQFNLISQSTGINIDRDLKDLWGKEFAVIQLNTREKLGIFQVADTGRMNFYLKPISSVYAGKVYKFNNSNILYYFFGDAVKEFSRPFYIVVDNYLVTANTASTLQLFLTNYKEQKLLTKDQAYSNFSQFISNKSNIFYFIQNKNSENLLKGYLKTGIAAAISDKSYGLKDFYGASLQWSSADDYFYTNFYANYTNRDSSQMKEVWKYPMNGSIAIAPQVFEGVSEQNFILVQDNINNIYSLTDKGEKIWATQLDGQILGSIQQLNDHSLVFNTASKLYRTDTHGNNFPGFPVTLPQKASYSATLSSTNAENGLIIIPCHRNISAFTPSGRPIDELSKSFDADILYDLKIAETGNTHFLIAGTENGKFYFFNLNGGLITKAEDHSEGKYRNPVFTETGASAAGSKIITSDSTGSVTNISFTGKISKKDISSWSADHFFDYKNIGGNNDPELIYLDKNQLYVYNSDSSLVFNYEFPYPITQRPQFFKQSSFVYQLGISSAENHLLYLFNEDGTLAKGFPFKGEPGFFAGSINKDGQKYLVCGGRDHYLYVYKL